MVGLSELFNGFSANDCCLEFLTFDFACCEVISIWKEKEEKHPSILPVKELRDVMSQKISTKGVWLCRHKTLAKSFSL